MSSPTSASNPQMIRGALRFYKVCSYVTGVLLIFLCAEMVIKYVFGYELQLGGHLAALAFVPSGTVTAVNLSTGILILHGWFYVVYLFSDMRLWSAMRWSGGQFFLIALGGVVPFLSFFVEARMSRKVCESISVHENLADAEAVPVEVTY